MAKTGDHFLCGDCGYEGPVNVQIYVDMVPYGEGNVPMLTESDYMCPACDGDDVEEI